MDPNAALAEALALARSLVGRDDSPISTYEDLSRVMRLADLVLGLDDWLLRGGALPDAWGVRRLRPAREP